MTASSLPAPARLILAALGSHEGEGIFAWLGTRVNLMTSWPWLARDGMSAEPMRPEAPVTRILMGEGELFEKENIVQAEFDGAMDNLLVALPGEVGWGSFRLEFQQPFL